MAGQGAPLAVQGERWGRGQGSAVGVLWAPGECCGPRGSAVGPRGSAGGCCGPRFRVQGVQEGLGRALGFRVLAWGPSPRRGQHRPGSRPSPTIQRAATPATHRPGHPSGPTPNPSPSGPTPPPPSLSPNPQPLSLRPDPAGPARQDAALAHPLTS